MLCSFLLVRNLWLPDDVCRCLALIHFPSISIREFHLTVSYGPSPQALHFPLRLSLHSFGSLRRADPSVDLAVEVHIPSF